MAASKTELIALLRECALLKELNGDNPFSTRAFENAARALDGLEGQPDEWIETKALDGVKGIGKGLRSIIDQYVSSGRIDELEELRSRIPAGLVQMADIPGLGPKKIRLLWEELQIDSVASLKAAAETDALSALPGFGKKTAEKILKGIDQREKFSGRHLISLAWETGEAMRDYLESNAPVDRLELAGSLRRRLETVKDLDIVVVSEDPEKVMEVFVSHPDVAEIVAHGATKSSVLLHSGLPVDLRVVAADQFGAALNYFTGSKEHNTHMRGRAKKAGLRLNEYGLFREGEDDPIASENEPEIYEALGLTYVEPELREDKGEVEAAESGELPKLITADQLRGLLHCHSTYSDGKATLREMAEAAREFGYEYFCICDHSQTAAYAGGLKADDLKRQHAEVDELNSDLKGITILKGIESDILKSGALDYPDDVLDSLDFVVASIHNRFGLDRKGMTKTICTALEHPSTRVLGHMSGRLLLRRDPYELDLDAVFETAAKYGVAIEINANANRLDIDWREIRRAKRAGCIFSINPDAHTTHGIADNKYGVGIARKGWLGADDVINCMTLKQFKKWLALPQNKRSGWTFKV